jgi:formylglycine-generating enzyme required for sulfatase activity
VNCVDWTQAGDYCRWAGGTLPTAAEWEYAARSGVPAPYPWGTEAPNAAYARFDSLDGTAPVASYEKGTSRWGFVDLAGNVAEWTASDYSLKEKEVRGGSWTDTGRNLRVSARSAQKPGSRSDVIGFRCAFHEVQASQPP